MDDLEREQLARAEKELREVLEGLQPEHTVIASRDECASHGIAFHGPVTIERLVQYIVLKPPLT